MKTSIISLIIGITVFLFSGFAVGLRAQSIVEEQVLEAGYFLILDGYELTHEVIYGNLYDDRYDDYYFKLSQGWTYQIFAVCDGDCSDIDLCLFDENENSIDCDRENDDKPFVSVTPKWSGKFRLWVKMFDCRINPCGFGIAVFGKRSDGI